MKLPFGIPWWAADLATLVLVKLLPIPPFLKLIIPAVVKMLKELPETERKETVASLNSAASEAKIKGDVMIFTKEVHRQVRRNRRRSSVPSPSETIGLD